jgi:hypothetical protein
MTMKSTWWWTIWAGLAGSGEYRQNADDCRQRSAQARLPADKANWLKIAEEWQKLAEEVDLASVPAKREI